MIWILNQEQKQKMILKKISNFKLTNNAVFWKTMENVRKHRGIKSVTADKKGKQLALESSYHTPNFFSNYNEKKKVKMNKAVYLSMSILDISKILMYKLWYDYIKHKYQDYTKLCYIDIDSFIIYIKTEDFYKDIADDVEKWFETSNYSEDDNKPLLREMNKNKSVILRMI